MFFIANFVSRLPIFLLFKAVVVNVIVDLQAVRQMKETLLTVLLQCMNQRMLNIRNRWDQLFISKIEFLIWVLWFLQVLAKRKSFFSAVGKSLILKVVDSARMLYSGPNIELLCKKGQLPKYTFQNGTEMLFKKKYPMLHVGTL